jgi:hypothetical protein
MKVKVIDAICGAGKTSFGIQYMNENSDERFIYVTPFLEEVKRIKTQTISEFVEPDQRIGRGRKIEHVRQLVQENSNIVMTHELFARLDEDILMTIKSENYILIMDEVANVINKEKIPKDDMLMLVNNDVVSIEEDDRVIWKNRLYNGTFNYLKVLSESKNLFIHNGCLLFWTMPVANFYSFKEVYILTYLFDGQIQKYYYDYHEMEYEKYSVEKDDDGTYKLIDYNKKVENREEIGELIHFYEDYQNGKSVSKLNTNYLSKKDNPEKALSKSWFDRASEKSIKQLKNNITNYCRNQCKTDNNEILWTVFKSKAPLLKNPKCKLDKNDNRLKDNFLPFNTRATNQYSNRKTIIFAINRFMDPNEKQFFYHRGIEVNEDLLALSDLIQFLFRGCIRNKEPMSCYIPSKRMRDLLKSWIEYSEMSTKK